MIEPWAAPAVVAMALLVISGPASAQSLDTSTREEANTEFEAGTAAFQQADYPAALAHFQRAEALRPNAVVRYNIANCLDLLGRYREAHGAYAALRTESLDEALASHVRQRLDVVRSRLGAVRVRAPEGAELAVDREVRCEIPCETLETPGRHHLTASLGDREAEHWLEVTAGESTSVALELPPPPESEPRSPAPVTTPSTGPSPWLWVGLGVAAVGAAGTVGFGVRTLALEREFDEMPSEELQREGRLMGALTTTSMIVLGVGVAVVVLAWALGGEENPRAARLFEPMYF
ncbi:MAG: tetratricopeptide repeat protein [Myxococcota bacterium]